MQGLDWGRWPPSTSSVVRARCRWSGVCCASAMGARSVRHPIRTRPRRSALAIAADQDAGYALRERFTRHFGVWREAEDGPRSGI